MGGERTVRRCGAGPIVWTGVVLTSILCAQLAAQRPLTRVGGKGPAVRQGPAASVSGGTATASSCSVHGDCDDLQGCTEDMCSDGACVYAPIPDCVPCRGIYICPPVDMVFIVDTSGSMRDEAAALCTGIQQLVTDLEGLGIEVNPSFLGITETPADSFPCLTHHVVGMLGPQVPGDAGACPFPDTLSAYESWGPATAIVAERFPWTPGSARLIVPISDEGPCDGSRPEGCNDPGDDRNAVQNAIAVATSSGVIVSPIAGTGSDSCVLNLTTAIANGTGGVAGRTNNPKLDFTDMIAEIILNRCSSDDRCDDRHVCTTNDRCIDDVCVGTPIDDCQPCISPAGCDDHDACTDDDCRESMCVHTLNYDESTECCAPLDGTVTPIDDADPCTLDDCDEQTGMVNHPPAPQGTVCVDGKACTLDDRCDGKGRCEGTDAGTVECLSDADCHGFTCDAETQRCVCGEVPELCLTAVPSPVLDAGCFSTGDDLFVDIELGSGPQMIVGGQFLVGYNPAVLDFVDVEPGAFVDPTSPFGFELMRTVNEAEGTVFYAVGIPIGMTGTRGPALMARLRFRALAACTTDEVCFLSENPRRTILTDSTGHQVPFTTCCTGDMTFHEAAPALVCPSSQMVHADPGKMSATVNWQPPTASGGCDEIVALACSGSNSLGADVGHLVQSGGRMPAGTSQFQCTARDSCGAAASCEWTIVVQPTNTVEVDVQLSPVTAPGPVRRCIVFEFYSNCTEAPVIVEQTLEFGQPFNLPGRAYNVLLELPAGEYECVTARDPKHTLRSLSPVQISGNRFVANFVGDPRLGGNWLVAGDLDDNGVIDSMDESLFFSQNGTTVSPHTPCGTPGIHADMNGDGLVNTTDLGFIQHNFLALEPPGCCGSP